MRSKANGSQGGSRKSANFPSWLSDLASPCLFFSHRRRRARIHVGSLLALGLALGFSQRPAETSPGSSANFSAMRDLSRTRRARSVLKACTTSASASHTLPVSLCNDGESLEATRMFMSGRACSQMQLSAPLPHPPVLLPPPGPALLSLWHILVHRKSLHLLASCREFVSFSFRNT